MSHVTTTPSATDSTDPDVRPDAAAMVSRVAQGAHATVDRLADAATPAAQKIEATLAQASESVHEQMHRAREAGDEWSESLRDTVRQHPLTSVMVALAAGALIARLSR